MPLGLLEPQTEADQQKLEQHTELVLKTMINAAEADGQIDEEEIHRIVGKLQEVGADAEDQGYVLTQMQKPLEMDKLISSARGRPELAAQIYAASLMAIEVDTAVHPFYVPSKRSPQRETSTPSCTGLILDEQYRNPYSPTLRKGVFVRAYQERRE